MDEIQKLTQEVEDNIKRKEEQRTKVMATLDKGIADEKERLEEIKKYKKVK